MDQVGLMVLFLATKIKRNPLQQSIRLVFFGWYGQDAGGLVDDQQMFIFVNKRKRPIAPGPFGFGITLMGVVVDRNFVTRRHPR